jgi:hypothetical protein
MDHLSTNTVVIEAVCRASTPVDLMSLIAVNTVWQAVGLAVYREKLTESIASACVDIIGDVPCRPASGTDSPEYYTPGIRVSGPVQSVDGVKFSRWEYLGRREGVGAIRNVVCVTLNMLQPEPAHGQGQIYYYRSENKVTWSKGKETLRETVIWRHGDLVVIRYDLPNISDQDIEGVYKATRILYIDECFGCREVGHVRSA